MFFKFRLEKQNSTRIGRVLSHLCGFPLKLILSAEKIARKHDYARAPE